MASSKSLNIHVFSKIEAKGVLVSLGNVGGHEIFPTNHFLFCFQINGNFGTNHLIYLNNEIFNIIMCSIVKN
jgi:hypothetical protein